MSQLLDYVVWAVHAAPRRPFSRRSQRAIWFQLANVGSPALMGLGAGVSRDRARPVSTSDPLYVAVTSRQSPVRQQHVQNFRSCCQRTRDQIDFPLGSPAESQSARTHSRYTMTAAVWPVTGWLEPPTCQRLAIFSKLEAEIKGEEKYALPAENPRGQVSY